MCTASNIHGWGPPKLLSSLSISQQWELVQDPKTVIPRSFSLFLKGFIIFMNALSTLQMQQKTYIAVPLPINAVQFLYKLIEELQIVHTVCTSPLSAIFGEDVITLTRNAACILLGWLDDNNNSSILLPL